MLKYRADEPARSRTTTRPLPNDRMGTEAPNHGSVLDATNAREKLKQLIGVNSLV